MKAILQTVLLAVSLALPMFLRAQTNPTAPLPTLEAVLSHAADAVQKEGYYNTFFDRRYCYHRTRITETRYSSGKFKDSEQKFNTNSPSIQVASLPLPPFSATNYVWEKKRGQILDIPDLTTNVLAHSKMKVLRRDVFKGRPTLVIEFKPPDKPVAENNLTDRLINRTAGQAWVDERDYTVSKLEAHLLNRLNVLGGIALAVFNGSYSFERQRTDEGIWYASDIKYNADLREVILYRTIDYHEQFRDVHLPVPGGMVSTTR